MDKSRGGPVVILGAGGTGLWMVETIEAAGGRCAGFLDDSAAKQAEGYEGLDVLGGLDDWRKLPPDTRFLSSLYGPKSNGKFLARITALEIPPERWATVVHPNAVVSRRAKLGPGVYVGPACVVEAGVTLSANVALLGGVCVAHHSCLDEYVVCANSASLAGGVQVGEGTFVGLGARVHEYTRIGRGAVLGMGSVVIRDVPDGQVVVGNPARAVGKT